MVQYKTFEVVFQKKIAEDELVDLFVSQIARKIIFTALDCSIYFMEFERLYIIYLYLSLFFFLCSHNKCSNQFKFLQISNHLSS